MDNSIALLIIVKKEVNVGAFITWCSHFGCLPTFKDYIEDDTFDVIVYEGGSYRNRDSLGTNMLNEFEFNYLLNFFNLIGVLHE